MIVVMRSQELRAQDVHDEWRRVSGPARRLGTGTTVTMDEFWSYAVKMVARHAMSTGLRLVVIGRSNVTTDSLQVLTTPESSAESLRITRTLVSRCPIGFCPPTPIPPTSCKTSRHPSIIFVLDNHANILIIHQVRVIGTSKYSIKLLMEFNASHWPLTLYGQMEKF